MIIVGGVYQEICRFPRREAVFGSGLRAAIALSELDPGVELHGFLAEDLRDDVRATLAHFGVADHLLPSRTTITFSYLHPIEKLAMDPPQDRIVKSGPLRVEGEAILQFGLVEAAMDVEVHGARVVYDPQTPNPVDFWASGSTADELAIVANGAEILKMARPGHAGNPFASPPTSDEIEEAIPSLFDDRRVRAILVKDFFGGLTLYRGDAPEPVRRYGVGDFERIGAGDVIAAGFAYAWAKERRDISEAADFSARCLAFAAGGSRLPISRAGLSEQPEAPEAPREPQIRIVTGDTLALQNLALHAQRWATFINPKAGVQIDRNFPGAHVLLILDDGRVGDALDDVVNDGKPCVVYGPGTAWWSIAGRFPDAIRTRDFANALYQAMRVTP